MGLAPGGAQAEPGLHDFLDDGYGPDGAAELARRLEAGEDLSARAGAAAETPLHVAARRRRPEAVRRLLDHGADIDARTVGREDRLRARRAPRFLRAGESAGGARGRHHARPCRPPRRRRCGRATRGGQAPARGASRVRAYRQPGGRPPARGRSGANRHRPGCPAHHRRRGSHGDGPRRGDPVASGGVVRPARQRPAVAGGRARRSTSSMRATTARRSDGRSTARATPAAPETATMPTSRSCACCSKREPRCTTRGRPDDDAYLNRLMADATPAVLPLLQDAAARRPSAPAALTEPQPM